jgi:hypothetical protein
MVAEVVARRPRRASSGDRQQREGSAWAGIEEEGSKEGSEGEEGGVYSVGVEGEDAVSAREGREP